MTEHAQVVSHVGCETGARRTAKEAVIVKVRERQSLRKWRGRDNFVRI